MSKIHLPTLREKVGKITSVYDLFLALSDIVLGDVKRVFKLTRGERNELFLTVLNDIAKGADGIFGTHDDLLDRETVAELGVLMNTSLVQHISTIVESLRKRNCAAVLKRLPLCCYSAL